MDDYFICSNCGWEWPGVCAYRSKALLSPDSRRNGVHLIAQLLHRFAEAGYIGKEPNPLNTAEFPASCATASG